MTTSNAFDAFQIARKVTDTWLADASIKEARLAVLTALSAPQDGGKGKSERRVTVGWIVAHPLGGWHRIDAVPRQVIGGVQKAESVEKIVGVQTLREPHVVLRLAKAGVRPTDFAVSYGDQLRIGEAGKGVTLIDLRRVRPLVEHMAQTKKPDAKPYKQTKRIAQDIRLGGDQPAKPLDPTVLQLVEEITDAEIDYAVRYMKALRDSEKKAG